MKLIAKSLYGLEDQLAAEIKHLGGTDISVGNRAVIFHGNENLIYRINFHSRVAISVLKVISEFRIGSSDDLYKGGMRVKWSDHMSGASSFAVIPVVKSTYFPHTGFAALKLKDSIADQFRNTTGKRPSVDTANPDIQINLHISHNKVTVSLDSSGEPLFKRGYRRSSVEAPLNEVLAAGMILLTGWDRRVPFIDPMCGSGTLPVEAAMIAAGIPPGTGRRFYSFMKWPSYNPDAFELEKNFEKVSDISGIAGIFGSDISPEAVRISELNAENAGVADLIQFSVRDFREIESPQGNALVIINPPYGERLDGAEPVKLYGEIGTTLKHRFPGSTSWIISPNRDALKNIGLKPVKKFSLFNGSLECSFQRYDLYSGSKKGVNQ